ncbi:N-acetylglucosamine-6-phosphate deacetylase [Pseudoxanthomonas winnipegensis]|uniref:N-acetylglucosamine-6-phosphate deacetylase n=1 Tax=Pseudoxanthomonas winnipegensis TaxID=2480810 RepID=A0A4Q8L7Q5_9GAMM|nr:N-acetylglucosamine-6-phosphate deacetylase [Pseudoxanthomonas winnipegensis]RZZ81344.1 N-acetylglucosamine-6-phosphate deacetylase [Pseudoxanthomonas winnipegensis]TAA24193.1 N-acetylglucosamine-6-phosphate deacetylase [Pseudoxanthomonas winnipegensis]TAA36893.1 N-acetylglucosamine-6-phosphate deacetylase [Pseudoxanthomonas winnipegensis]TBV74891.1 N-acetylglucosamine-6-phosphate deacetylase [Pseudoxanthomonas winnipegensis]
MSIFALVNARVFAAQGLIEDGAVVVRDGRIAAITDRAGAKAFTEDLRDLGGAWLAPGFIDIQVNGGGGVLFNNTPTAEGIDRIGRAHRKYGTTAFLPTLISDRAEVMDTAIAATRQAIADGVDGVLGIHLEGPYLAPARKGTHDAQQFRVPGDEEIAMVTALDNGLTLMTVAPEAIGPERIAALVARGAIVVAGHTAASYEQVRAGLDAGLRGFTHLYNAMSPLQGREPGAVGAALEDPHSWCGMIVDGVHVHPASLRVALAAKPRGKLVLVTDAMPMVGDERPSFDLYGETITAIDGVVRNAAGSLAGSALDMASAVRNAVHLLGLPLEEALRMATLYPAQFLRLEHERGAIAEGLRADLVALDEDLRVVETWIGGKPSL